MNQLKGFGVCVIFEQENLDTNSDIMISIIESIAQGKNVCMIFDLYVHGKSVIGTATELERLGIKSPTGKDRWSKRAVDVMLSNEKYIGTVCLLNYGNHEVHYF